MLTLLMIFNFTCNKKITSSFDQVMSEDFDDQMYQVCDIPNPKGFMGTIAYDYSRSIAEH